MPRDALKSFPTFLEGKLRLAALGVGAVKTGLLGHDNIADVEKQFLFAS
jgi:hypothetical protein